MSRIGFGSGNLRLRLNMPMASSHQRGEVYTKQVVALVMKNWAKGRHLTTSTNGYGSLEVSEGDMLCG